MIKYKNILSIFICAMILNFTTVEAANNNCTTGVKKQLAQDASHIKISYEIKDFSEEKSLSAGGAETTYKIPNYIFEISVYNLTEDVYIYYDKSNGSGSGTIRFEDALDGVYTFTDDNFGEIYNYNFSIRSNHPDCEGATLRSIKFTKPRYNAYSEFTYCQNSTNFYCQRFIGTEINIKNADDFLNKIKVNNDKNNPNADAGADKKIIANLFKSNWKTYLLVAVILAALATGSIFLIKRRQKKSGWKL